MRIALPAVSALLLLPGPADAQTRAGRDTYYRYCADAHAAGVTPIRRGAPGYASHLDRDNDGIACEVGRTGRSGTGRSGTRRRARRR